MNTNANADDVTVRALLRFFVSGTEIKQMEEEQLRVYVRSLAAKLNLRYWDTMDVLCDMTDKKCLTIIFAKTFFDDMTAMICEKGHSMPEWNYSPGGAIQSIIAGKRIFVVNDECNVYEKDGSPVSFATPRSGADHLISLLAAA
jgi:hypothetical protein